MSQPESLSSQARIAIRGNPKLLFGPLSPVLRSALLPVLHCGAIQGSAHNVVTNSREVFYAAPADEDDAMFLEVMTLSADISDDLFSVRKTNPSHFSERRVRLFWGFCLHLKADASALRTLLQSW